MLKLDLQHISTTDCEVMRNMLADSMRPAADRVARMLSYYFLKQLDHVITERQLRDVQEKELDQWD